MPQLHQKGARSGRYVPVRLYASSLGCPGYGRVAATGRKSSLLSWVILGGVAAAAAGMLIALQTVPAKPNASAFAPGTESSAPVVPGALIAPNEPVKSTFADTSPAASVDKSPFAPSEPIASAPDKPLAPKSAEGAIALEDIVTRSIPAIVSIETDQGRGSGFFAAPRTVLTNRHVIQDHVSVTVRLSSGQTLPGRVERSSTEYDLAVVRVDGASPSQPVLPLGTVNDVRPGQEVIAIGLALGVFQNSVTRGIISAVRRAERTVMLQTDAAINPGNSGGPLLNRSGQVVGINTLKIAGAAESLGFAVAVDHARGLLGGGRQPDIPLSTIGPGQPAAGTSLLKQVLDRQRSRGGYTPLRSDRRSCRASCGTARRLLGSHQGELRGPRRARIRPGVVRLMGRTDDADES